MFLLFFFFNMVWLKKIKYKITSVRKLNSEAVYNNIYFNNIRKETETTTYPEEKIYHLLSWGYGGIINNIIIRKALLKFRFGYFDNYFSETKFG